MYPKTKYVFLFSFSLKKYKNNRVSNLFTCCKRNDFLFVFYTSWISSAESFYDNKHGENESKCHSMFLSNASVSIFPDLKVSKNRKLTVALKKHAQFRIISLCIVTDGYAFTSGKSFLLIAAVHGSINFVFQDLRLMSQTFIVYNLNTNYSDFSEEGFWYCWIAL